MCGWRSWRMRTDTSGALPPPEAVFRVSFTRPPLAGALSITVMGAPRQPMPVRRYGSRGMTWFAILRHLAFGVRLAVLSALVGPHHDRGAGDGHVSAARKAHDRPTPKGGGAGIVIAFPKPGLLVLYGFAEFARLANEYFLGVIAASVAIAVVAFLDDLYDFSRSRRNWGFRRSRRWSRSARDSTSTITACRMPDLSMWGGLVRRRLCFWLLHHHERG